MLEWVGDVVTVQLFVARMVAVTEDEADGEPDMDADRDRDGDLEPVFEVDVVEDGRGDRECELLTETVGVQERVGGDEGLTSGERDTVEHFETGALAVADAVDETFALPVDRRLGEDVDDVVTVKLRDTVTLGDGETVKDWIVDRDADALRVMVGVADDDDDPLGDLETRLDSVAGSVTDTVAACVDVSSAERLYVAD